MYKLAYLRKHKRKSLNTLKKLLLCSIVLIVSSFFRPTVLIETSQKFTLSSSTPNDLEWVFFQESPAFRYDHLIHIRLHPRTFRLLPH